jgi:hypothetical protein
VSSQTPASPSCSLTPSGSSLDGRSVGGEPSLSSSANKYLGDARAWATGRVGWFCLQLRCSLSQVVVEWPTASRGYVLQYKHHRVARGGEGEEEEREGGGGGRCNLSARRGRAASYKETTPFRQQSTAAVGNHVLGDCLDEQCTIRSHCVRLGHAPDSSVCLPLLTCAVPRRVKRRRSGAIGGRVKQPCVRAVECAELRYVGSDNERQQGDIVGTAPKSMPRRARHGA